MEKKTVTIHLPPEVYESMRQAAKFRGVSLEQSIEQDLSWLSKGLARQLPKLTAVRKEARTA